MDVPIFSFSVGGSVRTCAINLLFVLGLFLYPLNGDQYRVVFGQKEGRERLYEKGEHAKQRDDRQGGRHLGVPRF